MKTEMKAEFQRPKHYRLKMVVFVILASIGIAYSVAVAGLLAKGTYELIPSGVKQAVSTLWARL